MFHVKGFTTANNNLMEIPKCDPWPEWSVHIGQYSVEDDVHFDGHPIYNAGGFATL